MGNNMIRMYLSEFDVYDKNIRHKDYNLKVSRLIEMLKGKGISIVTIKEFELYKEIEDKIDECDLLLAIVDEYWTSSTWKASEVTYANGDKNGRTKRISIFIFPVYDEVNLAFLKSYSGPIILPSDVDKAIEIIIENIS